MLTELTNLVSTGREEVLKKCEVRNKHYAVIVDGKNYFTAINEYGADCDGFHTSIHAEQNVIRKWIKVAKERSLQV